MNSGEIDTEDKKQAWQMVVDHLKRRREQALKPKLSADSAPQIEQPQIEVGKPVWVIDGGEQDDQKTVWQGVIHSQNLELIYNSTKKTQKTRLRVECQL